MTTRLDRITRAKTIISSTPSISKRSLQSALKKEFGVGLADVTRRQLIKEAQTPSYLIQRINTPAFTFREKLILKGMIKKTGSTPYMAKAVNDRFEFAQRLHNKGLTNLEIRRKIHRDSKKKGFLADETTATKDKPDGRVKGQVDWWKLLRFYRDNDIDRGEYFPKVKKARTDKGDIKAQKVRQTGRQAFKQFEASKEKQRESYRKWIQQIEMGKSLTTDKEQLAKIDEEIKTIQKSLDALG